MRRLFHRPAPPDMSGLAKDETRIVQQTLRRVRLLLPAVFVRILYYHLTLPLEAQMNRLTRGTYPSRAALPDYVAPHAAFLVSNFVKRLPILHKRGCYWRSQLIHAILRKFGYPVRLHLGTRSEPGKMAGHMWVSLNGRILADTDERCQRFSEIMNWPGTD